MGDAQDIIAQTAIKPGVYGVVARMSIFENVYCMPETTWLQFCWVDLQVYLCAMCGCEDHLTRLAIFYMSCFQAEIRTLEQDLQRVRKEKEERVQTARDDFNRIKTKGKEIASLGQEIQRYKSRIRHVCLPNCIDVTGI